MTAMTASKSVFLQEMYFLVGMQVKLQHLVTIHVRSSAFGSKEDAGMFMKGLAVQYDVWAETYYQRMLSVSVPVNDLCLDHARG